jgi:hypothetical protein
MKDTEPVERGLKLLRESDAERGAPESLEARLRAKFRRHHARPRRGSQGRWMFAVAAGLAIGAVSITAWRTISLTQAELPKLTITVSAPPAPESEPVPKRVVAKAVRRSPAKQRPSRGETQEFLAIPFAPPLHPEDRGEVVRMGIPRQSLRSLGIPVNMERMFERVPADVLVGEDGIARGIRLVRASETR